MPENPRLNLAILQRVPISGDIPVPAALANALAFAQP
jgi:hypothetical protein